MNYLLIECCLCSSSHGYIFINRCFHFHRCRKCHICGGLIQILIIINSSQWRNWLHRDIHWMGNINVVCLTFFVRTAHIMTNSTIRTGAVVLLLYYDELSALSFLFLQLNKVGNIIHDWRRNKHQLNDKFRTNINDLREMKCNKMFRKIERTPRNACMWRWWAGDHLQ